MSFKKKMSLGILTGALGLTLIGGGTWAAFNDVETTNNYIAAGTLDLVVNPETLFDLSNMKPGDYITKTLTFTNNGSLAIDEILLNIDVEGWEDVLHGHLPDNGENTLEDFLNQFQVVLSSDVYDGFYSLAELSNLSDHKMTVEGEGVAALLPGESFDVTITLQFLEDDTRYPNSRLYEQNKYQGEGATIKLNFEATQMPGEEREND
ncbi:TasA family protein [Fervidibacillus halotolerans]|uniref:CalY family protein n=1 Tax=Fervidibacillus halotolerans TaxID=2980027 RepID=A0A9E8RWJ7_9BACI|nr:TasA family protein [Fervidibacillus halotolerans]WAA11835.1 CalY family protein [Fervidibacillus halotolerans]